MGKKQRKNILKKEQTWKKAKEEAMIAQAVQVAKQIGLEVDFEHSSCRICLVQLSKTILECRDKGLIFMTLSNASVFQNCSQELRGSAIYMGRCLL